MPSMKRVAILSACVLLAACALLPRHESVRGTDAAIEVAQKACNWEQRTARPSERWHASRHGVLWHVWLTTESGDSKEPICCEYRGSAALDVWIRADTGKSSGCSALSNRSSS